VPMQPARTSTAANATPALPEANKRLVIRRGANPVRQPACQQ